MQNRLQIQLSLIALGLLSLICLISVLVVPVFREKLNRQFMLGARNQAFQMFASRMSQPMLRLVGLWQQFQQADIAVKRLGENEPSGEFQCRLT